MEITLRKAIGIIEELLKHGEHDGNCDNIGCEDECACDLHLESSEKRDRDARVFIKQYYDSFHDKTTLL